MNSDQLRRLRENLTKRWAYARHDLRQAKERREVLTPHGLRLLRRVGTGVIRPESRHVAGTGT